MDLKTRQQIYCKYQCTLFGISILLRFKLQFCHSKLINKALSAKMENVDTNFLLRSRKILLWEEPNKFQKQIHRRLHRIRPSIFLYCLIEYFRSIKWFLRFKIWKNIFKVTNGIVLNCLKVFKKVFEYLQESPGRSAPWKHLFV